jgi:hypothetical protein
MFDKIVMINFAELSRRNEEEKTEDSGRGKRQRR